MRSKMMISLAFRDADKKAVVSLIKDSIGYVGDEYSLSHDGAPVPLSLIEWTNLQDSGIGIEDRLQELLIPYDKVWQNGVGGEGGLDYCRVTPTGEISQKIIPFTEEEYACKDGEYFGGLLRTKGIDPPAFLSSQTHNSVPLEDRSAPSP